MRCLALWGLALATLWGCAPPPPVRLDWSPPQGLEALLQRLGNDLEAIGDLRAEAEVSSSQGGRQGRASAAVLFKQPDLLRVEVRGPFFVHLLTVVLQGDSLILGDEGGAWFKGPASGPLLARLIGVDLQGHDLRHALLGLVAPATLDPERPVEYPRPDQALVWLRGSGPVRRLWIDTRRGLVNREEFFDAAGGLLLVRRLREYERVGRLCLPHRVEILQGENSLKLRFRRWTINAGLEGAAFTRGIPLDRLERLE